MVVGFADQRTKNASTLFCNRRKDGVAAAYDGTQRHVRFMDFGLAEKERWVGGGGGGETVE